MDLHELAGLLFDELLCIDEGRGGIVAGSVHYLADLLTGESCLAVIDDVADALDLFVAIVAVVELAVLFAGGMDKSLLLIESQELSRHTVFLTHIVCCHCLLPFHKDKCTL